MRTLLATILPVLVVPCLQNAVYSSSFFPTAEEAEALKMVDPVIHAANEEAPLKKSAPSNSKERRYIRIDDMLFDTEEVRTLSGFLFNANQWTNGRVYFLFDPNVSSNNRQRWRNAARLWSGAAAVSFVERTVEFNYIIVTQLFLLLEFHISETTLFLTPS